MITRLDGKELADNIYSKLETYITKDNHLSLAVIQIGNNEISNVYIENKRKACKKLGINFLHYKFSDDIKFDFIVDFIKKLNEYNDVTGIIIQKPIPDYLNGIDQYISPNKDVDGFTFENIGKLISGYKGIVACTPSGIIELLKRYEIDLKGKHVVIIGRSNIVGKPMAICALNNDATVTICHSKTKNLKSITSNADILISAIGKPKYINREYITSKCICIVDVGINKDEEGKLCGDCDYDDIIDFWNELEDAGYPEKRYITPVPGGVGPLTVASLINNLYLCSKLDKDEI